MELLHFDKKKGGGSLEKECLGTAVVCEGFLWDDMVIVEGSDQIEYMRSNGFYGSFTDDRLPKFEGASSSLKGERDEIERSESNIIVAGGTALLERECKR